jgi:hypothetical protein
MLYGKMLHAQIGVQQRRSQEWVANLINHEHETTALFGATEWLLWALVIDPLERFELVDSHKTGKLYSKEIKSPADVLPRKSKVIVCTPHHNSIESIRRDLARDYPHIEVVTV